MAKPLVYILHGDDEYAIRRQVKRVEQSIGDPVTSQMNIDRFDGNVWDYNAVLTAVLSIPFLSEKRLVILLDPLKGIRTKKQREELKQLLSMTPPTTILLLQIQHPLVSWQERKKDKKHWLEEWANGAGDKAYIREYSQPHGSAMVTWILKTAKEMGGEVTRDGAELLARLTDENPRNAVKELEKLLSYVNYQRPIDDADVEILVANEEQGNVFELVDAIGNRNVKSAMHLLQQLLETEDPFLLFGMIVRQFRLLYLIKELLQQGVVSDDSVARTIHERTFVVRRLIPQSRNFTLVQLKSIYHQLLEIDNSVKSSQMDWFVALETFVASLTL